MKPFVLGLAPLFGATLLLSTLPTSVFAAEAQQATAAEAPASEATAAEQTRTRRRSRTRSYRTPHVRTRSHRTHRTRSSSRHVPHVTHTYTRHYRRPYVHYYTPPIVVTPAPHVVVAPPPVVYEPVVVHQPPVVVQEAPVVQQQVAHVEAPVVYEEAPPQPVAEPSYNTSIQVHVSGMNLGDTDLAFETIQGADLLGVGAALRFDLDTNWMIELGVDVLGAEANGVEQISAPITASAIAHLFPDSVIDPYAIAGLGIILTEYDDPSYADVEQYSQFMGHIGGGLEISLGSILVTSDVRFLMMQSRPDRDSVVPEFTSGSSDDGSISVRGEESNVSASNTASGDADAMNTGVQFMLGAGWRF